jgi:hypothetical protein
VPIDEVSNQPRKFQQSTRKSLTVTSSMTYHDIDLKPKLKAQGMVDILTGDQRPFDPLPFEYKVNNPVAAQQ